MLSGSPCFPFFTFHFSLNTLHCTLIVAVAENGAIGKNNQLLWHLPDDLKRFKRLTTGQVVVMGRKTYESIGKPLPNRVNVVISRNPDFRAEGCQVVSSLDEARNFVQTQYLTTGLFVIGGAEIYRQALPLATRIELTEVHAAPEGDAFWEFDREVNLREANLQEALLRMDWVETFREHHPADERHAYAFDFVTLDRQDN